MLAVLRTDPYTVYITHMRTNCVTINKLLLGIQYFQNILFMGDYLQVNNT